MGGSGARSTPKEHKAGFFLGGTFTVLHLVGQLRLHGCDGVSGQALVERIKGGMQVGNLGEQQAGGSARQQKPQR